MGHNLRDLQTSVASLMHWILNMNVAIFCQSMLLITVWCHLQIPSADRTACQRWLLSHQGLKNNGVAQTVTISAPDTLAAHSQVCLC